MKLKFFCPHCSQKIATNWEAMGSHLECPTCAASLTVPVVELEDDKVRSTKREVNFGMVTLVITAVCSMLLSCAVLGLYNLFKERHSVNLVAGSDKNQSVSEAAAILDKYLAAVNWQERLAYVRNPERVKPWMQDYYKEHGGPIAFTSMTQRSDFVLPIDYVAYEVAFPNRPSEVYFLEKTSAGYKIDWDMVVLNHKSTKAFQVEHPSEPEPFRVLAQLDTFYIGEYDHHENTYYSIKLHFPDGEYLHGYIAKSSVDGGKIFDHLKDGKEHRLILSLYYSENGRDPDIVDIYQFVQVEWIQKDVNPLNSVGATGAHIAGWYGFGYDYGAAARAANRIFGASNTPNFPALQEHLSKHSKGSLSVAQQQSYQDGYRDGLNGVEPRFSSQANPPE